MELRQLRYFVAIVESGSLSRAATRVHVVQSALSQQMGQLEQEMGVQLLERSVRGVQPTPAGQALYRHATQLVRLADETREVVRRSADEVAGRVRLGMPSSLALVLVGPVVAALERRHPRVTLEVYESPSAYLAAHLINQQVDISLLVDDVTLPGIHAEPLMSERLYFVQPREHPLIEADEVGIARLDGVPLMLTTPATTLRHLVDRAFADAGIVPVVKAQASSIQTLLLMVARGGAGTIVPRSALAWHAAARYLSSIVVTPRIERRATLAYSRLGFLSPAAAAVSAVLRQEAAALVASASWSDNPAAVDAAPGAGRPPIGDRDTDSAIP